MRRIERLITQIRRTTDNVEHDDDPTNPLGLSDDEILQYVNDAQDNLQARISETHPKLFITESFIDLVALQEGYALPSDLFLGGRIVHVSALFSNQAGDYYTLKHRTLKQRLPDVKTNRPSFYMRRGSTLLINPKPSVARTNGIRLIYQHRLNNLDLRRGKLADVNVGLSFLYTDTSAAVTAATVAVTASQLTLVITGGVDAGTVAFAFATYTTLTALVDAINAQVFNAGSAVAVLTGTAAEASTSMDVLAATSCLEASNVQFLAYTPTGSTTDNLRFNLTSDLPRDALLTTIAANTMDDQDFVTVVNSTGTQLAAGLPVDDYNSTTGILTLTPGHTLATGETLPADAYVVGGQDSTSHSELPDICERYLIAYASWKVLKRDSMVDSVDAENELSAMLQEIVAAFVDIDEDIQELHLDPDWII